MLAALTVEMNGLYLSIQSKASSSGGSVGPSTPQKQQIPQEQKEQQQRFLQENQLQKEQLQRLFKNEDSRPKKQRAYSSPAPYLSGQVPKVALGDRQENGVLPEVEEQSSRRKDKVKSLTLSDVKVPISSGEDRRALVTFSLNTQDRWLNIVQHLWLNKTMGVCGTC